jgi:hypothetical protein
MRRGWWLVVPGVALVLLAACKKASESTAEKAAERAIERATGNKADVNISGETVKITAKEGGKDITIETSGTGGVALPKGFPDDLPLYPDATVLSAMSQGTSGGMVKLQTEDAIERVYEFYDAKLRAGGWEIDGSVTTPEARMISGKKGKRKVSMMMGGSKGKSSITVIYNEDQG